MLALMSIFKRQNMEVSVFMDSCIPITSIKTKKKRKRYTASLEQWLPSMEEQSNYSKILTLVKSR